MSEISIPARIELSSFGRTPVNLIIQLTKLLDYSFLPSHEQDPASRDWIHASFLQAMVWSLGACLNAGDRLVFDSSVKYLSGLSLGSTGSKTPSGQLPSAKALLSDHLFQAELDQWVTWEELIPDYRHDRSQRFTELLVPTLDTVRLEWLLKSMVSIHQPVLFVGETGSSKTATIRSYLRQLGSDYTSLTLNFSSRTKSLDIQRSIESQLEKRSKDTYGPPAGTRLLVFLDDLSMPKVDLYGTQQAIALLKLLVEKQGMFERTGELSWKSVVDVEWTAAMGTPGNLLAMVRQESARISFAVGGGNNSIDPRFLSHFCVFYIASPSRESLFRIFSTLLHGHVTTFPSEVQGLIPLIIQCTLHIYQELLRVYVPTPTKFHYVFSLRDLSRIIQGLVQTTPERFGTIERFTRVWLHECTRVFADRFLDQHDQASFQEILQRTIDSHPLWKEHRNYLLRKPILFGDYRTALRDDEPKIYEDLQDYAAIKALFEEIILEFQEQYGRQDIILFDDALEHLTRIYRVLRLDRGHLLLIGAGGSGKQLLARVAIFAAKCQIFEIQLTRNYNEHTFRDDLKQLYYQVGLKNTPTVFLLNETHIVEESFLEYINNILSNGMIPALFADEVNKQLLEYACAKKNSSRNEILFSVTFGKKC